MNPPMVQRPAWLGWLLFALLLLSGLVNLNTKIERLARDTGLVATTQNIGYDSIDGIQPGSTWRTIEKIYPGSAMDNADVRVGDAVRFDQPLEYKRVHLDGQTVRFSRMRDGKLSRHELTYSRHDNAAPPALSIAASLLQHLTQILTMGLGLLLIWRRWHDRAAVTLGLVIFGLGTNVDGVPVWSHSAAIDIVYYLFNTLPAASFGLFPLFCHFLSNPADTGSERKAAIGWAMAYAAIALLGSVEVATQNFQNYLPLPATREAVAWIVTFALAIAILVRNFRRNDALQRNRIRIIAAAFLFYTTSFILDFLSFRVQLPVGAELPVEGLEILTLVAATLLFTYAMLRHRLFDFSFAINRTLVFAVVSFVLLASFGLAEWAVEHLVPEEWHKAGPFYSAAIALGLFLTFHRIRDFAEHQVEALFFREWQRKEQALQTFVDGAGYYEDQDALAGDMLAAISAFSGTDRVALFWRTEGKGYQPISATASAAQEPVGVDDPAVIRAKLDRGAVQVRSSGSRIAFDLVLPIVEHGRLGGFVALGDKPDAPGYRPDEVDIMASAVRKIGLDFLALRAHRLEARITELEAQLDWSRQVLAEKAKAPAKRAAGRPADG